MTADRYLHHATEQRYTIRFYNALAKRRPHMAFYYRKCAKDALRRACFYLDEVRIRREKRQEMSNA